MRAEVVSAVRELRAGKQFKDPLKVQIEGKDFKDTLHLACKV